jgi:hypothetical protein
VSTCIAFHQRRRPSTTRYGIARKLARSERARFLAEELDLEAATDMAGAEWAPFRLVPLKDDGRFGVE